MRRDRSTDLVSKLVRLTFEFPRHGRRYSNLRRLGRAEKTPEVRSIQDSRSTQDSLRHVGGVVEQDSDALKLTRSQRDGVLRYEGGARNDVVGGVDRIPPRIRTAIETEAGLDRPVDASPRSQ